MNTNNMTSQAKGLIKSIDTLISALTDNYNEHQAMRLLNYLKELKTLKCVPQEVKDEYSILTQVFTDNEALLCG